MEAKFGKYTVKREDKFNLSLWKSVPKGTAFGKVGVGDKEKFIGYYSNLSGALIKLLNNELLESGDILVAEDILKEITRVETLIKLNYDVLAEQLFKEGV